MAESTILVVDDSPVQLSNIKSIVEDAGYTTITACSGKEALFKAVKEQPSLIFMDIIMPDMDGFEACRKLSHRPETKGIPVVFVTTKGQKADQVWAKMQGGKGYITKPYSEDEIIDQIKAFL